MSTRYLIVVLGLVLAGWGHVLLHDRWGAAAAWRWMDDRFPAPLRSPAPVAGAWLPSLGALGVLVPILG